MIPFENSLLAGWFSIPIFLHITILHNFECHLFALLCNVQIAFFVLGMSQFTDYAVFFNIVQYAFDPPLLLTFKHLVDS